MPLTAYAEPDQDTIRALIIDRAAAHGADANLMLKVAWCESKLKPSAKGKLGEVGVAQWLPGRKNIWDYTSAYKVSGIDIVREYQVGNPDAPYFDVDSMAEMFAKGHAVIKKNWTCA